LWEAGITDIGIILGNVMPERVQEFLGDGGKFGVRSTYIVQGEPKGIAQAVNCAKEFMGEEPFIVYLGDNLLKNGIGAIHKKMREEHVGKGPKVLNANGLITKGERLVVGEDTTIYL
jgi:glucose-1-phosphate thymidylyltransferase